MQTGTIKWFDKTRGYGFIAPEDGSRDVLIHYSSIREEGFQSLNEGQKVEFESQLGPKGPQATVCVPYS
ncbi:cold-shock protein [Beggiatoa leptomitoformis]|uniref:Cold-shock protein n=1 Tax=Beggiatoa leptomitoformis TaxID=288004 RepID=A0A2N9YDS8_9GAMM|nr:cold-shock protein [Beggiatoa leptomitoformis]ALG68962.1 cold-shock protein [Beggiatoa leptomitoformis]AUI68648.1 cold-shock protein [Beggiatoa leptomitoformis]